MTWLSRTASPKTLSLFELHTVSTLESGEILTIVPCPSEKGSGGVGMIGGVGRLKLGMAAACGGVCPLATSLLSGSVDATTVTVVTAPPGAPPGGGSSKSGDPLPPIPPSTAA